MVKHLPSIHFPDTGIEQEPKEKYARFVKDATQRFLDIFKHEYPSRTSEIQKKTTWVITQKRLWLLKNIFIRSVEEAISNENRLILEEEYKQTIEELKKIIRNAKHDLDYISDEVKKKVDEEFEYG